MLTQLPTLDVGCVCCTPTTTSWAGSGRPAGQMHGLHFGRLLSASTRHSVLHQLGRLAEEKTRRFTTHFRAACAAARFSGDMTGLAPCEATRVR